MTKEQIIKKHLGLIGTLDFPSDHWVYSVMDEYANPYKEIADLISRIFYHGNFKVETHNERILEQRLKMVGLWPTTEDEIIQRPLIQFIEQQNKDNGNNG